MRDVKWASFPQIRGGPYREAIDVGWASPMDEISLTRELLAQGYDHAELHRMQRRGELSRIRRGAYAVGPLPEPAAEPEVDERHRQLIGATAPQLLPGAVVSHGSAAVLHGLPVWPKSVTQVHVTRSRSTGAKRRSLVEVHGATLSNQQVAELDGVPVTSLARTVLDLGRTLPFEQSVAAGDAALRLGLNVGDLEYVLLGMEHWPGVRRARRMTGFLDADSESAGESVSRVRLMEAGLPRPTLQKPIYDAAGYLVGRTDFCWEEERTVAEFDGMVKFGRLLKPGQSLADVVFAEKQREDAIRDLGWQVVRWLWADLYRRGVICDRVLRAFGRSR